MSTLASMTECHTLPLHDRHTALKAKMGHFGDWEVPLYFTSILEEHEAVRTRAGLFDISHMGKFYFSGNGTTAFFQSLLPRDIAKMKFGQALYMPLLNERGGFVDDIIVYRAENERYYMIVNAGNKQKDADWIRKRLPSNVTFQDFTAEKGLLALQGPKAAEILDKICGEPVSQRLKNYSFTEWKSGIIARTGYTGEDGFEIMADKKSLGALWDQMIAEGASPVGFGARDTLRLEAAMPLYGHDMDDNITPLEAGFEWTLDWNKGDFVGKEPLAKQKAAGVQKKLIGFEMLDRGIPRQDYEIRKSGKAIGKVTSGTFAPTLRKNIGLGYVTAENAAAGNEIEILVRDKAQKAKIIPVPFYKRTRR